MKKLSQRKMLLCAILAVLFIKSEDACSSGDKESVPMSDEQILQIEYLWKSGKPREYYLRAADVTRDITTNSTTKNLNQVAARLFGNLISKEAKTSEVGVDDLSVMQKLASYLISNHNASTEDCRTNIQLLSMYLGRIRKEIVPNFEPKPTVENVAPPPGIPGMAGMDPAAITNPVARAEYEASIRANQENSLVNSRQVALRSIEREMSKSIMEYMIRTFRAAASCHDLLHRCMSEAKFSDSEQREVLNRIAREE